MRMPLLSAVQALLAHPRLAGQKDVVRLGLVVFLAKASHRTCRVAITARELGRWLGVSKSTVAHEVLPALQNAGLVVQVVVTEQGEPTESYYRVVPLWEARSAMGSPFYLHKHELATLLRFLEGLFAPGWGPTCETPPGLLAARRARGAATDRLALLLLALHARPDGRVRLAGGRLAADLVPYGRAVVTLARMLGCEAPEAASVLKRLEEAGLVRHQRSVTERLHLPAIAAAHRLKVQSADLGPVGDGPEEPSASSRPGDFSPECPKCQGEETQDPFPLEGDGWRQASFEDLLTETSLPEATAHQGFDPEASNKTARHLAVGRSKSARGTAHFHTNHSPVADLPPHSADHGWFSGSAVVGGGGRPERTRAREVAAGTSSPVQGEGGAGPLRGERPGQLRSGENEFGKGRRVFGSVASVPNGLGEALAPVARLWSQLGRSSTRRWLAGLVRGEVGRLRGLVGPELAQRVLAERLQRRLDEQGSPVGDLVGWLVKRGLPQRPGCWSQVCDEGLRMDTRGACESCEVLVGDRRGLRQRVADQVLEERLLGRLVLAEREVGREIKRRLQEAVREELVRKAAARERAVAEQVVREASYELKRQAFAEAEWARAAAPCADCGLPEAAGLCLGCTERRGMEAALQDAVEYALALRFDPDDAPGTRALWQDCEQATRAVLAERLGALREQGHDEAALAFAGRRLIEELRDRRRKAALVRLGGQEEAEQAARMAAAAVRRKQRQPHTVEARDAVRAAGKAARRRVAERWLGELLAELRAVRSLGKAETVALTDWRRVLPDRAAKALPEDANGEVRELVSA
ncbi:hypothetical protein AB0N77_20470 [Streptomyces misionensis]|uniref:hypothetical protein n=1 Tax=Streptomyces misionensis TaxID=67331 RepID=UPI003441B203